MTLPIDLILIRHGESEGNFAHDMAKGGDHSFFDNSHFKKKHSSLWRLTDRGIEQAICAGKWIEENVGTIDSFYTSEYIRAMETAANLGIEKANWKVDFMLRERDWGQLDPLSHKERQNQHKKDLDRRRRDGFFFQPPGGESIAGVSLRLNTVLAELHKKCSDKKVIIVAHGEVLWSFRVMLENISQLEYRELDKKRDVKEKIHNCQIIHYTRRDPETKKLHETISHMRSVCPWDTKRSHNKWKKIWGGKKTKTNKELMQEVSSIPRTFSTHAPTPLPKKYTLDIFNIPKEYTEEELGEEKNGSDDVKEENEENILVLSLPDFNKLKRKMSEEEKDSDLEPKNKKRKFGDDAKD